MTLLRALVPAVGLALLVGACAPTSYVVLLPEEDGKVGAITVAQAGDKQDVTTANTALAMEGKADEPFVVDEKKLNKDFGAALAAVPLKPVHFLIYFEIGGTDMTADSAAQLPYILELVKMRPVPNVLVVGHADRKGDTAFNDRLSLARAQAVADRLITVGIKRDLIEVTSHGENNPLVPTADNVAEPRNRRVEITVQ